MICYAADADNAELRQLATSLQTHARRLQDENHLLTSIDDRMQAYPLSGALYSNLDPQHTLSEQVRYETCNCTRTQSGITT